MQHSSSTGIDLAYNESPWRIESYGSNQDLLARDAHSMHIQHALSAAHEIVLAAFALHGCCAPGPLLFGPYVAGQELRRCWLVNGVPGQTMGRVAQPWPPGQVLGQYLEPSTLRILDMYY